MEDLYNLLVTVKEKHPDLQALASGPINSNYQRLRIENVCVPRGSPKQPVERESVIFSISSVRCVAQKESYEYD